MLSLTLASIIREWISFLEKRQFRYYGDNYLKAQL